MGGKIKDGSGRLVAEQQRAVIGALAARAPGSIAPGLRRIWSDLLLLRTAIESSPLCVTVADMTLADQPLIYVNPAFERITGYTHDEVVGLNCRFLQGPETDPAAVQRLRAAIAAGEPGDVTMLNHRRDGSVFRNRVLLQPVRGQAGEVIAYVGHQLMDGGLTLNG